MLSTDLNSGVVIRGSDCPLNHFKNMIIHYYLLLHLFLHRKIKK